MENAVKISILLEIYGNLLTKKQYSLLEYYYNNDLSLSEIAENQSITRQAVRDNLKKGENKLLEYEEKLGFMKKEKAKKEQIEEVLFEVTKLEEKMKSKKDFEDIKHKLKVLI